MTTVFVNVMLFLYILSFFSGIVNITFNSLTITKFHSLTQSRLLTLNIVFFLYMTVNFVLFFSRMFVQLSVVSRGLLYVFDLLYALMACVWIFYMASLSGVKMPRHIKTSIFTVCSIYYLCWLISDIFFLADNQIDMLPAGKILTTVGEALLLVTIIEFTWYYYIKIRGNRKLPLLMGLTMCLYFVYCFFYNIDCVFRFIGPSNWPAYPFDVLIVIYALFNIFAIVSHYSILWKHKRALSREDIEDLIEELNSEKNLSAREKEVLLLMIRGKSNNQIADELVISIYTVKRHVNNIFKKISVSSRAELDALLH